MRLIHLKPIIPAAGVGGKSSRFYEAMGVFDPAERERLAAVESEHDLLTRVIDNDYDEVLTALPDEKLDKLAKLQRNGFSALLLRTKGE